MRGERTRRNRANVANVECDQETPQVLLLRRLESSQQFERVFARDQLFFDNFAKRRLSHGFTGRVIKFGQARFGVLDNHFNRKQVVNDQLKKPRFRHKRWSGWHKRLGKRRRGDFA